MPLSCWAGVPFFEIVTLRALKVDAGPPVWVWVTTTAAPRPLGAPLRANVVLATSAMPCLSTANAPPCPDTEMLLANELRWMVRLASS